MKHARFANGAFAWRPDPVQCHLWLWVADNFLPWAMDLMGWLGFEYKRSFIWTKPHQGMGQYAFSAHEQCLLGVMGKTRTMEAPIRSDFGGPIDHVRYPTGHEKAGKRVHSAKPPAILEQIDRAYPVEPGHGLEMFARSHRPWMDSWGNETNFLPQGQVDINWEIGT
jgi:N6-adenosine-specific RNA methylase IME4